MLGYVTSALPKHGCPARRGYLAPDSLSHAHAAFAATVKETLWLLGVHPTQPAPATRRKPRRRSFTTKAQRSRVPSRVRNRVPNRVPGALHTGPAARGGASACTPIDPPSRARKRAG
eukprot:1458007-Pleurochrysis_carterae.AAC.2